MPPSSRSLTLIAPQIAPALTLAVADRSARWPALAGLAGRGSLTCAQREALEVRAPLSSWQSALLDALGLGQARMRYPSAAVTWTGEAGEPARGFWMHAEPMHFAAGMQSLSALALRGERRVALAERAMLVPTLAAHLREAGFELSSTRDGDWLVRSERPLDVATATPEAAVANPLEQVMPSGPDAPELRKLMTELQMLLYEHPVSLERQRRGLPEVNAIWLHGEGALQGDEVPGSTDTRAGTSLPQAFGDDAYLRGIYRLHGADVPAAPADAQALIARLSSPAVAVIGVDDLDTLEALWLKPIVRALALGTLGRVELVLDRWRISATRGALLRLWRPRRSPAQWLPC